MMITRMLGVFMLAIVFYVLYGSLKDTVSEVVAARRPVAHRIASDDCCLIPANRGLYGGQQ